MDCIHYNYLPSIAQGYLTIETKYFAQGHNHVGVSMAQTHDLAIWSPALFHWTTHTLSPSLVIRSLHINE